MRSTGRIRCSSSDRRSAFLSTCAIYNLYYAAEARLRLRRAQSLVGVLRSRAFREHLKAALEIGDQIVGILKADMEADARATRGPFGSGPVFRAVEEDRQAFEAAPGIAESKQCKLVKKCMHRFLVCRLENDAEQAAGAGKIPFPDRMPRVALERRMHDAQNFRSLRKPSRDAETRFIVARESHTERAQAAQGGGHVVGTDAHCHHA